MRLNVCILFAWRQIARMKNSVNTNLLILDEIFDASLDSNGTDVLSTLLKTIVKEHGLNLFIVSHGNMAGIEMFNNILHIKKDNNGFSTLTPDKNI